VKLGSWTVVSDDTELRYHYELAKKRKGLDQLPNSRRVMVRFTRDGDFTAVIAIALGQGFAGDAVASGVSKKSLQDNERPEVGATVAFGRALVQLNNELF